MKKTVLDGITVLDFGTTWAGPMFARSLGDMGARVIKVESRRHLDVGRSLPPRVPGQPVTMNNSWVVRIQDRSKLGVSLNVAVPKVWSSRN
jgi:crotonobetainyl-CoA:carnitine CoA-transferase CaiB-like acyl-CoA transferase